MNSLTTTAAPPHAATAWSVYLPIAIWVAAVAVSWCALENYAYTTNTPSPTGFVTQWPEQSALSRQIDRPTLLLFLHPKCPCTRATLGELERLLLSIDGQLSHLPDITVVATVPATADDNWYDTDTVARAQSLPNASLFIDRNGVEAARFGATTSGLILLFSEAGVRQYAGGITTARGHEGDNPGRDAVVHILLGNPDVAHDLPAFGCRLCLPDEPSRNVAANGPLPSR